MTDLIVYSYVLMNWRLKYLGSIFMKKVPLKSQGEQGWRSGESARLPPMWPGFNSRTRRHMWVEFVVGSCPCSKGFSPGSPVFLPPQKPTFLNSNSTSNARSPLKRAPAALWCSVGKQITFTFTIGSLMGHRSQFLE